MSRTSTSPRRLSAGVEHLRSGKNREVSTNAEYDRAGNEQPDGGHQYAEHRGNREQYSSEPDVGNDEESRVNGSVRLRHHVPGDERQGQEVT